MAMIKTVKEAEIETGRAVPLHTTGGSQWLEVIHIHIHNQIKLSQFFICVCFPFVYHVDQTKCTNICWAAVAFWIGQHIIYRFWSRYAVCFGLIQNVCIFQPLSLPATDIYICTARKICCRVIENFRRKTKTEQRMKTRVDLWNSLFARWGRRWLQSKVLASVLGRISEWFYSSMWQQFL